MAKKRKNGEGTLRKRSDGRWEARVVIGYDDNNLPRTKNVTAVNKEKCLEKLERLKSEIGIVKHNNLKADNVQKAQELENLLNVQYVWPWYGQLMRTPQTIAYMLQLNCWLVNNKIEIA